MRKITLSLAVIAVCGSAYANEAVDLGDVSVTATRTERKVIDVPASIEVITQKDIKNSVAQSADELLKEVSGLDVKHSMGAVTSGTSNKIVMRGFGGTTEGRVLLLIDGVPMNDLYGGDIEWNRIPISAIERIEIVKGATSALYGSGAMGGVINIITKKPTNKAKTDVTLNYGSMNTKIGSLSTIGKVEKVGYFLSGDRTTSDGYNPETPANTKSYTRDKGTKRDNLNGKLTYDPDGTSSLFLSGSYYDNQTTGTLPIDSFNPYYQKQKTYTAGYTKKFENDNEILVKAFIKDEFSSYDSANSAKTAVQYESSSTNDDRGGTIQTTIPFTDNALFGTSTFVAGVDLRQGSIDRFNHYIDGSGKNIKVEGKQKYIGLFLQDEIFIGENWIINLGGRYDSWTNYDGHGYDSSLATTDTYYSSTSTNGFSPKIGIVNHLTDTTSFRASAGRAYRAPTLSDLYNTFVSGSKIWYGNPDLKPESVKSYEVGIDQKIFDTGKLSVTAYQSDAKDFFYYITTPPSGGYTAAQTKTNVGKVKIRGVEVDASYPFTDQIQVLANYTYNTSKIEEYKENTALEGKYLIEVPKHKGSISLLYANPNLIDTKISARYVGDRYSNDANTAEYKSYTLLDLKLSKKLGEHLEATLSVDDLFDRSYTEYYVSPGRVVFGALKMTF
ncbi:MAG: TonB-dependent receptor [Sulfuricurvum sp.]|uniref:TonB-dependent receptor plug domain-containing protein n=1 Tax=Sulfuricurvum sp. TaxID=2025608 RepID=UPI00263176B2|nr:TonB-dependent receptor [Sulfuricurvum sp.]MDD2949588.1 TonB-dependent receptor [Sulfuricurvum sp.]MDD5119019.1 TonB-dependent receptor [Sulfuricurvum sp.]